MVREFDFWMIILLMDCLFKSFNLFGFLNIDIEGIFFVGIF